MRFGFPPPENANPRHYWGARAIFTKNWVPATGGRTRNAAGRLETTVDLLPDRQTFHGEQGAEEQEFIRWINHAGLPKMREWAKNVPTDSRELFSLSEGTYRMCATPNGSHGYMYIGAWTEGETT